MSEHALQAALFLWANSGRMLDQYPELEYMFAIPNGGHRHPAVAAKMRQEGVKAGVPDIALMTPRNGRHGLFLELKNGKKGRVRESQREYLDYLNQQGYLAIVCHSLEEAQGAIEAYLKGMLT